MRLFWHRRDLRIPDNRGLAVATGDGPVIPVFVFDPMVLQYGAPPRVAFMLEALEELRAAYRRRGSDLLVERGDPSAVLPSIAATHDVDMVSWNDDYSGLARRRDRTVSDALEDAGVETSTHTDAVLHEPGSIRTNEGEPYSVFTYYWRKWHDRQKDVPYDPPAEESFAVVEGEVLPTVAELGFDSPEATLPPAGTEAARERLARFCRGPIYQYEAKRDDPAAAATSGLSPHLKFGTIGIREVYAATERARNRAETDDSRESVTEFQSQLSWREFYTQVLAFNPSVVSQNVKQFERPIAWRTDPEALRAWQDGETGYPIVDAGMRQLRATGTMHNRVRMIVASFLTKDLLLDWREGYAWFRAKLVDHDTANDSGGWQWAASTGTDAQPYFRIFNPMTQGERHDPDATYIKRWVPELRDVDPQSIHTWPDLPEPEREVVAPEYPGPIVDHAARREAAISMFEAARGED